MRILIAEDDFGTRRIMSKLFGHLGEVNVAVDGLEAISALESAIKEGEPYDLILLDVMMPNMDGHEVLKRIRHLEREQADKLEHRAKVIMTTVCEEREAIIRSFQGKCDGYLIKPVTAEMIMDELERLHREEEAERVSGAG